MRRRALVLVLGGVAAAWPFALWAQPQRGVWRIGYLAASPRPTDDVFRHALRELGYIEGHNLTILCRWGESGNYEAMAQDLVRLNVDLIVAVGSPAAQAAKNATRRIPIVFYLVGDPRRVWHHPESRSPWQQYYRDVDATLGIRPQGAAIH